MQQIFDTSLANLQPQHLPWCWPMSSVNWEVVATASRPLRKWTFRWILFFFVNFLLNAKSIEPKIGPKSWNVTFAPESIYQILAVSTISITSRAFSENDDPSKWGQCKTFYKPLTSALVSLLVGSMFLPCSWSRYDKKQTERVPKFPNSIFLFH